MPRPRQGTLDALVREAILNDALTSYRVERIANPAAGTDWTVTVRPGTTWLLFSVFARMVADANVATRIPVIQISDGSQAWFRRSLSTGQTASQTIDYSWASGLGVDLLGNAVNSVPLPTPPLPLPGGTIISVVTTNIQVGDQWSRLGLFVGEVQQADMGNVAARRLAELHGDNLD